MTDFHYWKLIKIKNEMEKLKIIQKSSKLNKFIYVHINKFIKCKGASLLFLQQQMKNNWWFSVLKIIEKNVESTLH